MNDIRENLAAFMKDRAYVQAKIARRAGIKENALSAVLSKRRKLEASELCRICEALGVPVEEIKNYKTEIGVNL